MWSHTIQPATIRRVSQGFFDVSLCCLEASKSKRVIKVPKGTSEYQASWIVDEDEEENGEIDEESSEEDDDDDNDNDMMDEAIDGEDEDMNSQVLISSLSFKAFVTHTGEMQHRADLKSGCEVSGCCKPANLSPFSDIRGFEIKISHPCE